MLIRRYFILFVLIIFLSPTSKGEDKCLCRLSMDGVDYIFGEIGGSNRVCESISYDYISRQDRVFAHCSNTMEVAISCNPDDRRTVNWNCEQMQKLATARILGGSMTLGAQLLENPTSLQSILQKPKCPQDGTEIGAPDGSEFELVPAKNSTIKLELASIDEVKELLNGTVPGAVFDRPENGWTFNIHLPNDNKGLGIFDVLFDSHGNDTGNTHGMKVEVSKGVGGGYHVTMEYSSNLYTKIDYDRSRKESKRSKSEVWVPYQNFLEDNFTKILIDNKDQDRPIYYRAGVGWHQINQERLGNVLFSAAEQQRRWHEDVLGPDLANQYEYIGGGGFKEGVYVEGAVGARREIRHSNQLRSIYEAEAGFALSGADSEASNLHVEGSASLIFQRKPDSLSVRTGIGHRYTNYFNQPSSSGFSESNFIVEIAGEVFFCGAKYTKRGRGRGPGYRNFDLDGEDISDVYCGGRFE